MKPRRIFSAARLSFPLAAALAALASASLQAANIWDGGAGTGAWNTGTNWDDNIVPAANAVLTFTGNVQNSTSNDTGADLQYNGILFTNDGSTGKTNAFTLAGNRITLGGNITTTANTAGSTITDAISLNMILNGDRTITTNQQSGTVRHNLTISGIISQDGSNRSLTKAGAGILTLSGTNTYAGGTTISAGTLQLGSGGTTGALTGTASITNNGNLTINRSNAFTQATDLNSKAISGSGSFSQAGSGTTTLSLANTYTGGTTITAGTLNVANVRGLGNSGTLSINGASTTRLSTDTAFGGSNPVYNMLMFGGGSYAGTIELNRATAGASTGITHNFGELKMNLNGGGAGQLNVTAGANAAGALDTIAFSSLAIGNNNVTTETLNPTGGIITAGATAAVGNSLVTLILSGTTAGNAINGVIGGTGNQQLVAISKTGTSTWTLSNAGSNYTGGTTFSGGTLVFSNGALGTTGAITASGGTLRWGSGNTQDISSRLAMTAATSTFDTNGNNVTFASSIGSGVAAALTKAGAGTLTLQGTNTYTGSTTVNLGTLTLDYGTNDTSKLSDTAALVLGGGTVNLSGGTHTEVVSATTLTAGTDSYVTRSSGSSVLQLGTITNNTGTLNIGGAGMATANNTHADGTILGTWATVGGDWAVTASSGTNIPITAYSGYTDVARLGTPGTGIRTIADGSATNVRLIEGSGASGTVTLGSATTQINTLNQSISGPGTSAVTVALPDQILRTNGILQGPTAGSLTIGEAGGTAALSGTLTSTAATGSIVVTNNSSNELTINSVIANNTTTSLAKSGTGVLVLNGVNAYTGATTVNLGTLRAGAAAGGQAFGNLSAVTLSNTANVILDLNNFNQTIGSLAGGGATGGNVTLGSGTLTTGGNNTSTTFGGVISGAGGLSKTGTGTQTLTGVNTYSGGTTISSGVLAVGQNNGGVGGDNISPDGTSTSLGSGAVSVAAGAALHINTAGLVIANNITLNGLSYGVNSGGPAATNSGPWNGALMGASKTGVVFNTFSGTITLNATSNVSTNWNDKTMIITGKVTGAGGLVIDNSAPTVRRGSLVRLSNTTNDYAGDTTVNNGNTAGAQPTLILGASNVIPDGSLKGNMNVLGNLDLNSFSDTVNGLSGSGVISNGVAATTSTLTVGNNDATGLNYSGSIQNGSGTVALTKIGTGNQTLSGVNTYTGNTTVSAGTLTFSGSGTVGNTANVSIATGAQIVASATTNNVLGFAAGRAWNISGTFNSSGGGAQTLPGTVNLNNGTMTGVSNTTFGTFLNNAGYTTTFTANGANNAISAGNFGLGGTNQLVFSTPLAGDALVVSSILGNATVSSQTGQLAKSGLGTLTLSATNPFLGATTINAGTLQLGNGVGGGTTGALTGTASITNNGNLTVNRSNAFTQATDLNGKVISGNGSFTQAGTGTTTLSLTNTYIGATNVNGGKLLINGSTSASSAVSVNSGGTLGGNGTIGGSVTVQAGGMFSPGNSIDSIASGNLALLANSTFAQEIDKAAALGISGDLTSVTGSLSITSGAILTLAELGASGVWSVNDKITLIGYSTGTWNGGLFTYLGNTLNDDSTVTFSGIDWTFNYDDTAFGDNYQSDMSGFTGSARYVTMTAVPEPSAALLAGLGTLALFRRRR